MKIALLQMTSGIDPAANARTMTDAIAEAAAGGAAMLFTPEMSGLLDSDKARAASSLFAEGDDPVLAAVQEAAAAHGIWVHLGSLAVKEEGGKLANRGFVIDAEGNIRAATTSSICSTSICRLARAGASRTPMRPARVRSWWRRRRVGSASPSVTICASPTCSAH